jgi:hypothetical protein
VADGGTPCPAYDSRRRRIARTCAVASGNHGAFGIVRRGGILLEDLLGGHIDVVSAGGLKDRDEHIRREAVLVRLAATTSAVQKA